MPARDTGRTAIRRLLDEVARRILRRAPALAAAASRAALATLPGDAPDRLKGLGVANDLDLALFCSTSIEPGRVAAVARFIEIEEDILRAAVEAAARSIPAWAAGANFLAAPPCASLGCRLDLDEARGGRDAEPARVGAPAALPPAADLAAGFGKIRDQGGRGTCVAFAFTAAAEYEAARAAGEAPDFSEQEFYFQAKEIDGTETPGLYLSTGREVAERTGVIPEEAWPYNPAPVPGNEGQGPPPETAREAGRSRFSAVEPVGGRDVTAIKATLAGGDGDPGAPVVGGFLLFRSIVASRVTGKVPLPLPGEEPLGGHAMILVGYRDDAEWPGGGYVVARNSWGEGWHAESPHGAGYCLLPYAYVERYASAEAYAIPPGAVVEKAVATEAGDSVLPDPWEVATVTALVAAIAMEVMRG